MRDVTGRRILIAIAATGSVLASCPAYAGAFGLRTQGTISLGQAFAGNASGAAGLSSMFWNPATITMRPGYTSEYNLSYVTPEAKITVLPPTPTLPIGQPSDIGQAAAVPATYTAYQLSDQLWIGLANAAPFGSITKPDSVWAGQSYSRSSRITSLSFTPILGYRFSDMLSIGFGPTVEYFKARLNSASGVSPAAGTVLLEGHDIGAGYTVGATLTPMAGTDIGVGFRSSVHHDLDGTLRTPLGAQQVRVGLNLPEQLTVGITQQITPELKLSAGFEWMNWSRLGTPAVRQLQSQAFVAPFPLNYRDGYMYSVGGEYQVTDKLALRVGVAYEESPIFLANRSTRLPDTDRIYASLGGTYQWSEKLAISAAYSHVFGVGGTKIRLAPGNPLYNGLPFVGDTAVSVDIASVALTYKWDDTRAAIAAPIVRKY